MSERRLRRSDAVVFDRSGERAVLLDGDGSELITLNPVGTMLWYELDGRRGTTELAAWLGERFPDITPDELRADVDAFLDELVELGLAVDAAG